MLNTGQAKINSLISADHKNNAVCTIALWSIK